MQVVVVEYARCVMSAIDLTCGCKYARELEGSHCSDMIKKDCCLLFHSTIQLISSSNSKKKQKTTYYSIILDIKKS